MALTIALLDSYHRKVLKGPPSIALNELVNQAGESLVNMHEWQWLVRPSAPVVLASGVGHVALPADFGRFIGLESPSRLADFELTSPERLSQMRDNVATDFGCLWGTIVYAKDATSGKLLPRLEIWPTPTTTNSTLFRLVYRAGWEPVSCDGGASLQIPSWCDALFLEVFLAVSRGYHEMDLAGLSARLAAIRVGPVFADAASRDGSVRPTSGQPSGGAMSALLYDYPAAIGFHGNFPGPSQP